MATINSVGRFVPQFMSGDGCGMFVVDKAIISSAPAVNDVIDFPIPAGMEVALVEIQCDDLDSNGSPTIAFQAGYAPANAGSTTLSASLAYFAAAGQVTARAGGRLACSFKPIKFNEDAVLRLTIGTAAATFAAGEIHAIVGGNAKGVR